MRRQTFKVEDMSCANCALALESLEDELPGVKEICASYRTLTMVVEYNPAQLTVEQIIAAVKRKGYTAVPVEGDAGRR